MNDPLIGPVPFNRAGDVPPLMEVVGSKMSSKDSMVEAGIVLPPSLIDAEISFSTPYSTVNELALIRDRANQLIEAERVIEMPDEDVSNLRTSIAARAHLFAEVIGSTDNPPFFKRLMDVNQSLQDVEDSLNGALSSLFYVRDIMRGLNQNMGSVSTALKVFTAVIEGIGLIREVSMVGSSLILRNIMITELKKQLFEMQKVLTSFPDQNFSQALELRRKIERLAHWLDKEEKALREDIKLYDQRSEVPGVGDVSNRNAPVDASIQPRASPVDVAEKYLNIGNVAVRQGRNIWSYFTAIPSVLKRGLVVIGELFNVVYYAIRVHQTHKNMQTHEAWIKRFKHQPVTLKKYVETLEETKKKAFYDQGKNEFEILLYGNDDKPGLLNEENLSDDEKFLMIKDELERRQIYFSKIKHGKNVKNLVSLTKWLENEAFRESLANQFLVFKAGVETIKNLQKKREVENNARIEEANKEICDLMNKDSFDAIVEALQSKGVTPDRILKNIVREAKLPIDIPPVGFIETVEQWENIVDPKNQIIDSVVQLKQCFDNPAFKKAALSEYLQYKEGVPLAMKNALQAIAAKKHDIEKNFFKFKLVEAATMFGITSLAASLALVVKFVTVAAVVGVLTIAMSATGAGAGAASFLLAAIGFYMFYKHKPNTFKEFFKLVKVRLLAYSLPHAIRNYQMEMKLQKQWRKNHEVYLVNCKIVQFEGEKGLLAKKCKAIPEAVSTREHIQLKEEYEALLAEHQELLAKREKFENQIAKIGESITKLQEKVSYWTDKMKPLQERWENAARKDFARTMNPYEEKAKQDITTTIVKGLIDDGALFNPDVQKILKEQFGVSLEDIANRIAPENKAELEEKIKMALKNFFIMDDSDINRFIERQQVNLRTA